MGKLDKGESVTLEELVISSLATSDAIAKLLIARGVISQDELMEQLSRERATYQAMFRQKGN